MHQNTDEVRVRMPFPHIFLTEALHMLGSRAWSNIYYIYIYTVCRYIYIYVCVTVAIMNKKGFRKSLQVLNKEPTNIRWCPFWSSFMELCKGRAYWMILDGLIHSCVAKLQHVPICCRRAWRSMQVLPQCPLNQQGCPLEEPQEASSPLTSLQTLSLSVSLFVSSLSLSLLSLLIFLPWGPKLSTY